MTATFCPVPSRPSGRHGAKNSHTTKASSLFNKVTNHLDGKSIDVVLPSNTNDCSVSRKDSHICAQAYPPMRSHGKVPKLYPLRCIYLILFVNFCEAILDQSNPACRIEVSCADKMTAFPSVPGIQPSLPMQSSFGPWQQIKQWIFITAPSVFSRSSCS